MQANTRLKLEPQKIIDTISRLSERIDERFPNSGLHRVSQDLLNIGMRAEAQIAWIAKPIVSLRFAIAMLILLILAAIVGSFFSVSTAMKAITLFEFIQTLEAGINDVVLIAIAVFFLGTLEVRLKRHRALKALHELRTVAHIIDMQQLTKDPVRLHWELLGVLEPKAQITPLLMARYLDYCSELLSLVGKISVLYVDNFKDAIALAAANEIESISNGLSQKIWQKLMIMHNDGSMDGVQENQPLVRAK